MWALIWRTWALRDCLFVAAHQAGLEGGDSTQNWHWAAPPPAGLPLLVTSQNRITSIIRVLHITWEGPIPTCTLGVCDLAALGQKPKCVLEPEKSGLGCGF